MGRRTGYCFEPPKLILGVGCGTGTKAIERARRGIASVVDVDGVPQVLAIARRETGGDVVSFLEAMADDLPCADDPVVTSLPLHYLASATRGIRRGPSA